jgi:DNA-binding MarR family transcriptional regulator
LGNPERVELLAGLRPRPSTLVCKRGPLFYRALPLYYSGMAASDKNSAILLSLLRALSGLDKNFPLPYAIFLLEVARNEGCSLSDLHTATGMPLPTLSRILWALSTKRQNGAEPYFLIEQDYAADNRRRKTIRLSAKGRRFVSRMAAILDQTAA